jgi:hypothetical protein
MAFLTVSIARPKKSALLMVAQRLGYTPQLCFGTVEIRRRIAYALDTGVCSDDGGARRGYCKWCRPFLGVCANLDDRA